MEAQTDLGQNLFKIIRDKAKSASWSSGVELHRAHKVLSEPPTGLQAPLREFRINERPGQVAPVVTLWLTDLDWSCTCESREEVCRHVVAAILALRQPAAVNDDTETPSTRALPVSLPRKIHYNLQRITTKEGVNLFLERYSLDPQNPAVKELLQTTLSSQAERYLLHEQDILIERLLGTNLLRPLDKRWTRELLEHLSTLEKLTLDGEAVSIGAPLEPVIAILKDQFVGFHLSLEQNPLIAEIFTSGIVRVDHTLHALKDLTLTSREIAELQRGLFFTPDELLPLTTKILPRLSKQVPLKNLSKHLPTLTKELTPTLLFNLTSNTLAAESACSPPEIQARSLTILPLLVYGNPPVARIDHDRLTLLPGAREIPLRDLAREQFLSQRLQTSLNFHLGEKVTFTNQAAVQCVLRLQEFSKQTPCLLEGAALEDFKVTAPLTPHLSWQPAVDSVNNLETSPESWSLTFTLPKPETRVASPLANFADHLPESPLASLTTTRPPTTVSLTTVFNAFKRGETLVPLLDGGFAPLPQEWLSRLEPTISALLAAKALKQSEQALTTPPGGQQLLGYTLLDLTRLAASLDTPLPPNLSKLRALLTSDKDAREGDQSLKSLNPEVTLPPDLQATLRSYQYHGVAWLQFLQAAQLGGLLADDMGLGKTLQALCILKKPTLIIAPTSVIDNWEQEIHKFRPALKIRIYQGANRTLKQEDLAKLDVVLTSYALLRLDKDILQDFNWATIILDEAQNIKNPDSQLARAAYALKGQFRLSLTGTPLENRLEELWSQFHFLNPGLLGGRKAFLERYLQPLGKTDSLALTALQERVKPFILRRLKREVAPELPAKSEVVRKCILSPVERDIYTAILATTQKEVVAKLTADGNVLAALEAILRLRQVCTHYALSKPELLQGPLKEPLPSSKLSLLLELLETTLSEGHKALIFSQWTSLLNLLEPLLVKAKINFTRLDGQTLDRGKIVATFQDPQGPEVLLLSLKAGGTGLNLTAADQVFILDPWWNPAVEDQAADRAHRLGQNKPVLIHRLIAKDTIEERILALQAEKRTLMQQVLETSETLTNPLQLTKAELLTLLMP